MVVKLLIIIVIVAVGVLFFIDDPDGHPTLTLDGVMEDLQNSTSGFLPDDLQRLRSPAVTKVYKWKDADGIWQFSNTPVDEQGVEVIELDGQINTIPAFNAPETALEDGEE